MRRKGVWGLEGCANWMRPVVSARANQLTTLPVYVSFDSYLPWVEH